MKNLFLGFKIQKTTVMKQPHIVGTAVFPNPVLGRQLTVKTVFVRNVFAFAVADHIKLFRTERTADLNGKQNAALPYRSRSVAANKYTHIIHLFSLSRTQPWIADQNTKDKKIPA